MHSRNGFTLIELLTVITIAAILASIAVPSFRTLIQNNNMTSQTNGLLGLLQLARSEAVTQRQRVTVCPSINQSTCDSVDWSDGGLARGDDGTVIRVMPDSAETRTRGAAAIVYETDGTSAGGILRVCDDRGDANSRTIRVNIAGQAGSRTFQAGDQGC